jgi:hypothetical protein
MKRLLEPKTLMNPPLFLEKPSTDKGFEDDRNQSQGRALNPFYVHQMTVTALGVDSYLPASFKMIYGYQHEYLKCGFLRSLAETRLTSSEFSHFNPGRAYERNEMLIYAVQWRNAREKKGST